jgi:hypothetical protein
MQYSLGNMLKGGGALNPDGLALDLAFALDKTLTSRKGPTPTFTRGSTGTFVGSNGLIQSAAINGPRFDHDPATGDCKGLLIEESRTNYIVQSENFTSWWATSAGVVSRNKETSIPDPAGTFNSTRLEVNATFNLYRDPILSVPDGTRAVSIFARAVTGGLNSIALLGTGATVRINLATGAVITNTGTIAGSLKVERFGAIGADGFNWWRISYATTDTTGDGFYIENVGTVSGAITAFLIFGAQYEIGAFPTSYLPTTSGTAIRSADVCSIIGDDFSSFYNQSEGTLLTDSIPQTVNGTSTVFGVSNGTANERFWNRFAPSEQAVVTSGGVESLLDATNPVAGTRYKIAVAVKVNDLALSLNGAAVITDTSQPMPTVDRAGIGNPIGVAAGGAMHIARIQYFRKRLPNAKLQTLTAP